MTPSAPQQAYSVPRKPAAAAIGQGSPTVVNNMTSAYLASLSFSAGKQPGQQVPNRNLSLMDAVHGEEQKFETPAQVYPSSPSKHYSAAAGNGQASQSNAFQKKRSVPAY